MMRTDRLHPCLLLTGTRHGRAHAPGRGLRCAAGKARLRVLDRPRTSSSATIGLRSLVHRYETFLNAGDAASILDLFAPESVAEWNDKPSFVTSQEKRAAYDNLFRTATFTTVFGYAGIDVRGDSAVVRTYTITGVRRRKAVRMSST